MKDLDFTDNEKIELAYDVFAGILAMVATFVVVLQFSKSIDIIQQKYLNIADNVIYFLFVGDFFIRLILSKDKKSFIRNHYIDFIAIIPFNFFTNSPYGSVLKLMRVLTYVLRLVHNIKDILYTNGFIYSLLCAAMITILGSYGIYFFESGTSTTIKSFGDAFWWSIVTVTTVGYGDISPTTTEGRVIAGVLMLSGIGFLSMLTSTVSTYFITKTNEKKKKISFTGEKCILDISELTEEKRRQLIDYYDFIKSRD